MFFPAAEDPGGGRHVQSGGGQQPPAGVRAQSRRSGGSNPAASLRRRPPLQRGTEHDLNLQEILNQMLHRRPGSNFTTVFEKSFQIL